MPGRLLHLVLFAVACLATLWLGPVEAASIETLLMPGAVIAGHAKYEQECSRCHDRSDRKAQAGLCRSCHTPIDQDIREQRGFHGRITGIQAAQCSACHSEHKGRNADVVKFSPAAFDHGRTDFVLDGAHLTAACDQCHRTARKYKDPPTGCADCHGKIDPHAGKLGRECRNCHESSSWEKVRYDHSKTKFALTGKHADATCDACHLGNRYAGTPDQCAACHAPDDVHAGARGVDCGSCHQSTGWTAQRYDHLRATGFALVGTHSRLDCKSCHRTASLKDPLPRDCAGCHRADEPHATRFGPACERCHGNDTWRPAAFDHTRDGKLELRGAHTKLDCHACHTAFVATQKLGADCLACHRGQDIHLGKLGPDCEQCHGVETWRGHLQFDHDFTTYPLVGLHVTVPCFACHRTPTFQNAPQACVDCHASDDRHKGSLGRECDACHSANGWNLWKFDHGKATKFALTGAHTKAACASCHVQPADVVKPSTQCASCHGADDVHLGQYGMQCQRCHVTTTFKAARIQREALP
jgi:hypothetical protein